MLLEELEPDLIVTQALCEVCAVSFDDVRAVAERLPSQPNVVSLDPSTIGEVIGDVRTLAQATDSKDAGVDLVRELAERLDRVKLAVRAAESRPRVLALEWLDPPFIGGHWVPQMIEMAGGEDAIGFPGERSREASWEELQASRPDVVVSMPCGHYAERAAHEVMEHRDEIARLGAGQIFAVDAAAYFSRPGPRLVDGVELLAPHPPPRPRRTARRRAAHRGRHRSARRGLGHCDRADHRDHADRDSQRAGRPAPGCCGACRARRSPRRRARRPSARRCARRPRCR